MGKMEPSCPLGTTRCIPQAKFPRKPYNRPIAPKMFSLPNSDRRPVLTYKVFAEKRPTQMNFDEAPFYLAVNNIKTDSLDKKPWFKQSPVGVNKLNSVMKVMSEKAELNKPRLKNHSGRKTMMQTLVNDRRNPSH